MGLFDIFNPPAVKTEPSMPQVSTVLTQNAISNIINGNITALPVKKLALQKKEECLFCDYGVMITEKLMVVGRQRTGGGFSVRILKGLTYHTGTGGSVNVRDKVPEYFKGKLYITNKRIIFSSDQKSFQKKKDDLISYSIEENQYLLLQFSNTSYKIYLPVAICAEKVLEKIM